MSIFKIVIVAAVAVVVLLACESNTKLASSTNNMGIAKKDVKVFTGKPAGAVDMHYIAEDEIIAGAETEIKITFINKKDIDDLLVSFKFDSGLVSGNHLKQYNFGILPQGQESHISLEVSAANNGLYYIYVTATLVTDKNQSRSFAIPVNVGSVDVSKSLKTMGKVKTDSAGRRIITMPAQMQ